MTTFLVLLTSTQFQLSLPQSSNFHYAAQCNNEPTWCLFDTCMYSLKLNRPSREKSGFRHEAVKKESGRRLILKCLNEYTSSKLYLIPQPTQASKPCHNNESPLRLSNQVYTYLVNFPSHWTLAIKNVMYHGLTVIPMIEFWTFLHYSIFNSDIIAI